MDYPRKRSFSLLCGIYCLPVVIILSFLALYYFHIENRKEQFSRYFLRQLSTTGSNIRDSINGLRTNLANCLISNKYDPETEYCFKKRICDVETKDYSEVCEKQNTSQKTGDASEGTEKQIECPRKTEDMSIEGRKVKKRKEYIQKQLSLIPSLDPGSLRWKGYPPEELLNDSKMVNVRFSLILGKDGYVIKAKVSHVKKSNDDSQSDLELFEINAGLEKLVIPLLPDDVFENFSGSIVLAQQRKENVLLETGSSLQLITLPRETPVAGKENEPKTEEDNTGFLPVRDVEIGLNRYKLFLHPFRWHFNESTGRNGDKTCTAETAETDEDVWLVGAFIPQSTFLSKAMEISPTLGLIIFCVLCAALLVLPFLRVRLIGRREGVKAIGVFVLSTALLMGCSLISLLSVNLLIRNTEINMIDSYLKAIAGDIGNRFSSEFSLLENELIRQVLSEKKPEYVREENILSSEGINPGYPFFELLAGMDKLGNQAWKWSIRKTTTPMLKLNQRKYFKYAKDFELGLFEKVKCDRPEDSKDIFMKGRYIESIRSKNTGESFAMLSLRKNLKDETSDGAIVFVIQAMPLCLVDPVMPPGFGFALIDQDGTVQFHSSSKRNLRENFFLEATPRENLEAISKSIIPAYTDLEYRASDIRAYIMPFSGTPWTLVVFSDKSIPYHLGAETITFTAALYGAYLLLLVIICLVLLWLKPEHQPGEAFRMWLWPNVEQIDKYLAFIIFMIGLWIIWGICILYNTPPFILVLMSVIPPILLLLTIVMMLRNSGRKSISKSRHIYPKKLKIIYTTGALGLLLSLAVLPPVGIYLGIYKEEAAVFIKYHQYEIAQSIRKKAQMLKEKYKGVELSDTNREKMKRILFHDPAPPREDGKDFPEMYTKGFDTILARNIPEALPWKLRQRLIAFLSDIPMLHNSDKMAVITRMFSDLGTDPEENKPGEGKETEKDKEAQKDKEVEKNRGIQKKEEPETDWFIEYMEAPKNPKKPDEHRLKKYIVMLEKNFLQSVYLGLPDNGLKGDVQGPMDIQITTVSYEKPHISTIWLTLCVLIVFLILYLLIKAFMKMIFVIDIIPPVSIDGKVLVDDKDIKNQIQIRLQDDEPVEAEGRLIIAPNDIRESVSLKPLLEQCRTSAVKEIILDRFDTDLDEAPVALKKLILLEGLAPLEDKRVIIRTAIDPLFLLTSRSNEQKFNETDKNDLLLTRWAVALQDYSKLRSLSEENGYYRLRNDFMDNELSKIYPYEFMPEKVRQCLADEGWPNRRLKEYAKKLAGQQMLEKYSVEDIVDQFRDLADAHYRKIWLSCSTDEKIILFRLAQQGFVNWRMKNALRSLIKRRIVVMAPNFRLMNESFRQFVLMAENPQSFQKWEEAEGISVWGTIKTPLILMGIALCSFFFITQREAFGQSLRILSAVAAGVPIIFKAFEALTQSRKIPPE